MHGLEFSDRQLHAVSLHPSVAVQVVLAIGLVCAGVGISTVTDDQMGSNMWGWAVGAGAILSTAAYQLWAGSMQKGAHCDPGLN